MTIIIADSNPSAVRYIELTANIRGSDSLVWKDSSMFGTVRIFRENSNGVLTLLGHDFVQLSSVYGTNDINTYLWQTPFLTDPQTQIHIGDKLEIRIRLASAPILNRPVVFSPYETRMQVIATK